MKRKRRIEIYIERREISVFAGAGALPGQTVDLSRSDGIGLSPVRRPACPTCGSSDLVLLTDAVTRADLDIAFLNQGMQDGRVHYHCSPSGEWWICAKSLQRG